MTDLESLFEWLDEHHAREQRLARDARRPHGAADDYDEFKRRLERVDVWDTVRMEVLRRLGHIRGAR